jgi:hypothetical protein
MANAELICGAYVDVKTKGVCVSWDSTTSMWSTEGCTRQPDRSVLSVFKWLV